MMRYRYDIVPDDNDTFLVTGRDLPIVTYGVDEADAMRHIEDAVTAVMQSMINAREVLPDPQFEDDLGKAYFVLRLQTELKARLHNAMLEAGLTRADLQRRLGWQRESVDRLFRLGHASKIEQLDEAMRAVGSYYDVHTKRAA